MSQDEKDAVVDARAKAVEAKQAELDAQNAKRVEANPAYKGTFLRVGQTRGKNPQMVVWEAFDLSKSASLPTTVDEFMKLTNTKDEATYISYLIDGYNDAQYTLASDPIAEHVDPAWSEDVQKQFRLVVRNYSAALQVRDRKSVV